MGDPQAGALEEQNTDAMTTVETPMIGLEEDQAATMTNQHEPLPQSQSQQEPQIPSDTKTSVSEIQVFSAPEPVIRTDASGSGSRSGSESAKGAESEVKSPCKSSMTFQSRLSWRLGCMRWEGANHGS